MPDLIRDHDWGRRDRPRVLLEASEWRAREALSAVLREAGYDTVACAGPEGTDHRCALAAGEGCSAAAGADVIVHTLRSTDPRNLEAFRALRQRLPDTPVVVEVPAIEAARRSTELEGSVVVEKPASAAELLAAVSRALGSVEPKGG